MSARAYWLWRALLLVAVALFLLGVWRGGVPWTETFSALWLVGIVVHAVLHVFRLLELDAVRRLDRPLTDLLMQAAAHERLRRSEPGCPHVIFIDIDDHARRRWHKDFPDTPDFMTPRGALAEIMNALASARNAPKLIVLDIILEPANYRGSRVVAGFVASKEEMDLEVCVELESSADRQLTEVIRDLAAKLPVIVVQPAVADWTHIPPIYRATPSIFERYPALQPAGNLWFASALLNQDSDHVVRSVPKWHPLHKSDRGDVSEDLLAGIGFLGAALLDSDAPDNLAALKSYFPAFSPGPSSSSTDCGPVNVAGCGHHPREERWPSTQRFKFELPYDVRSHMPTAQPRFLQVVKAEDARAPLEEWRDMRQEPVKLDDAVVVIGCSFPASEDLHYTPLGSVMPGAMIHANAICAFRQNKLIKETDADLSVMALLIGIVAIVGAWSSCAAEPSSSPSLGHRLIVAFFALWLALGAGSLVWGSWRRSQWHWWAVGGVLLFAGVGVFFANSDVGVKVFFAKSDALLGGTVLAFGLVFLIGYWLGYHLIIEGGTALGTFTPAVVVALEGFFKWEASVEEALSSLAGAVLAAAAIGYVLIRSPAGRKLFERWLGRVTC